MRHLLAYLLVAVLIGLAGGLTAQSDEGGRVERLIERSLSAEGRAVELVNFTGALSSTARFDILTVADADGVWLRITEGVLAWSASELLSGTLQVSELSAATIDILRQPLPAGPEAPSASASGWRVPELPVALNIDQVTVPELRLGAELAGQAARLSLDAGATLNEETATLRFLAQRLDGPGGKFNVNLRYDREAGTLLVDADLSEPPGGLMARSANIPDAPALAFTAQGSGPIGAFGADISLRVADREQVEGRIEFTEQQDGVRSFSARLDGDLTPLLQPRARSFFGDAAQIALAGKRLGDGALEIETVQITAAQINVDGALKTDGSGQLVAAKLQANLAGAAPRIMLPASDVSLARARLSAQFDRARSDSWQMDGTAEAVTASGAQIETLQFAASGLVPGRAGTQPSGQIEISATGVALDDPGLDQLVGATPSLATQFQLTDTGGLMLSDLSANVRAAVLTGTARADPAQGRMKFTAELSAQVPDLATISRLARPVTGGAADLALGLEGELPGGAVAVTLRGTTRNLTLENRSLSILLGPETRLDLVARRDLTGTSVEQFNLENLHLFARGSAQLGSGDGDVQIAAELADLSLLDDRLSGPGTLQITGSGRPDGSGGFSGQFEARAASAQLSGEVSAQQQADDRIEVALDSAMSLGDLADFAGLAPTLKGGAIESRLTASGSWPDQAWRANLKGQSTALDLGIAQLAPILRPDTTLDMAASGTGASVSLDRLALNNKAIWATARGQALPTGQGVQARVYLRDAGALTGELTGPVVLQTEAARTVNGALEATYSVTAAPGTVDGRVTYGAPEGPAPLRIDAAFDLDDVTRLARLGQVLRTGSASGTIDVEYDIEAGDLDLIMSAQTAQIDTGTALLAPLTVPPTDWTADLSRRSDGAVTLKALNLRNSALEIALSGDLSASGESRAVLDARLTDAGFLAPPLAGSLRLQADMRDVLTRPAGAATLRSAAGLSAQIDGSYDLQNGQIAAAATGQAPLSMAQPYLGARVLSGDARFTAALNGAPVLSSLSAQITSVDARLSDPGLGLVVSPLALQADVRNGAVTLDATGTAGRGGDLRASGTVGLTAPNAISVDISADDLKLRYRDLLQTSIDSALTLDGAAQGQLRVSGEVVLSETEVRVPESGVGGGGAIPEIRHLNAPAQVRTTLDRAGNPTDPASDGGAGGLRLPLDIELRADDPIFVRGRGLDAEFVGQLRLTGRVADPVPVGRFELRRGRMNFLGRRLTLTEGALNAEGSLIPRLRILAEAQAEDIIAGITLEGPADRLAINLTSQPPLPEDEILARLLFGKSTSSLSAFQLARLISSLAELAGRGPGVLENTRRGLGVDDLDLRTDAQTGEAQLAVGQYLNENVYSEVELGAQGSSQLNLNLDLNDETRLRGSVNSEGQTGVGVFWQRDY